MLQKILNLFRRKKKIVFKSPKDILLTQTEYFGTQCKSTISDVHPEVAAWNKLHDEVGYAGTIKYMNGDIDPIFNVGIDSPSVYPFPSDSGPDWPSITSDSVDISSSDQPSDSNSFDFGGGSGDGGGATGEY
jgi:uncharacterized membrane protein YgcG